MCHESVKQMHAFGSPSRAQLSGVTWMCHSSHACRSSRVRMQTRCMSCVTRRKLQTPGSATVGKEQNGRRTPSSSTLKSNDREFAQRTDQAPGTIKTAAQESSRTTLTDTATLHASGTATSSHHHTNPASSSQQSSQPTQPSAHRKRTEPH